MKTYKGVVSRWVNEISHSAGKFCTECAGQVHIVLSKHGNVSAGTMSNMAFCDRCLPPVACSTAGLFLTLMKFAYFARAKGGLACPAARTTASIFLGSLVDFAIGGKACSATIFLDQKWTSRWPRPPDRMQPDVVVAISPQGFLDLDDLASAAQNFGRRSTAASWVRSLRACLGADACRRQVHVWELLEHSAGTHIVQPFLAQTCVFLVVRAEARFLELAHECHKAERLIDGFAFRFMSGAEAVSEQMDLKLAQYVLSGAEEGARAWRMTHCLTISTDKASVCGLPIQNVLLSYPTNLGVVAVPQAVIGRAPEGPYRAPDLTGGLKRGASTVYISGLQARTCYTVPPPPPGGID